MGALCWVNGCFPHVVLWGVGEGREGEGWTMGDGGYQDWVEGAVVGALRRGF